jgi:hypothetical protein
MTRLPTERLATACWAFIVAKTTGREPASLLDFRPLQRSDTRNLSTSHPQAGKHPVDELWGTGFRPLEQVKLALEAPILDGTGANPRWRPIEVKGH